MAENITKKFKNKFILSINKLFSIFIVISLGVMPIIQSYKIFFNTINKENSNIDTECFYFNYFSNNQAVSLAILGFTVVLMIIYAFYKNNFIYAYISFAIAVSVLFGFVYGGCIIGK